MSKTLKGFALFSGAGLTLLSVGAITLVWKNWDLIWSQKGGEVPRSEVGLLPSISWNKTKEQITETIEISDLNFKLLSCTSKAVSSEFKTITCPYLATSLSKGAELNIESGHHDSPTRLIDDRGLEYIVSKTKLGASVSTHRVSKTLIKDVPIRGEIIFERIPTVLNKIVAIEVNGEIETQASHDDFKLQFRKITLSENK
ncbi:MAG: hypothetical protein QNJ38_04950 [Prochloraceae cyanobacterium]|nr:hypothetical protein [Prochloraceae cyanobacterium]